jgi:cell division protein FtsB
MEPFELEPMALIEAQQQKIAQLTNENVQLTAAVAQLRQQLTIAQDVTTKAQMELSAVEDVTDEVAKAEITA